MSSKSFWSIYAPYINDFIGLKRSLGYKYEEEERLLYRFDQFILDQGHTSVVLTKELSDKWADRNHNEAEFTIYYRFSR